MHKQRRLPQQRNLSNLLKGCRCDTPSQQFSGEVIPLNDREYASARQALLYEADVVSNDLDTRKLQSEKHLLYNHIDMNVFNFLGLTDVDERHNAARQVFANVLLTRNIDHTPEHAASFVDHIKRDDSADVFADAALGKSHFFCGFHTGAYWSVFAELIKNNAQVAAIFPPGLEGKRHDVLEAFQVMVGLYGSSSTLEFIDLANRQFLLHARRCVRGGMQIIVFIDGYGGYMAPQSSRDHSFLFLRRVITVKTSILRLSAALGVEYVSFNTTRGDGLSRTLLLSEPKSLSRDATDEEFSLATEAIFKVLEGHLTNFCFDWEGWIYFNAFLSGSDQSTQPQASWTQRYFQTHAGTDAKLVDKQTGRVFRVAL